MPTRAPPTVAMSERITSSVKRHALDERVVGCGAAARHGGHNHAVFQFEGAKLKGFKQFHEDFLQGF